MQSADMDDKEPGRKVGSICSETCLGYFVMKVDKVFVVRSAIITVFNNPRQCQDWRIANSIKSKSFSFEGKVYAMRVILLRN